MALPSPRLAAQRKGVDACTGAWDLLRSHERSDVAEDAQALAVGRPPKPSVIFLGEPGRGKSTLVRLLAPHDTTPATEQQLTNRFRRVVPPRPGAAPLRWLGVDGSGTDSFHEAATGIEVQWSSCVLGQEVTLLDTPCEGGIDGPQATVSRMLVRGASVGVFVTDAGAPLLQPEVDYLRAYLRPVDALVVVVTKTDLFPDSWSEVVETNRQVLRDHVRDGIPVVGLSTTMAAHARQLEDGARRDLMLSASGWTELVTVLIRELRRHGEAPMANALRFTEGGLRDLRSHLDDRLTITHNTDQDPAETIATLESELRTLTDHQQEWGLLFDRDVSLARAELARDSASRLEEWRTARRAAIRDIKKLSQESRVRALEQEVQQELNALRAVVFSEAIDRLKEKLRVTQVGEVVHGDRIDQIRAEREPLDRALAAALRDPLDISSGLTGFFGANISYSLATSLLHLSNPVGLALAAAGGVGYIVALRSGQHSKKVLSHMDQELARLAREEQSAIIGQWDQFIVQLKPEVVPAYRKLLAQKVQDKQAVLTQARMKAGATLMQAEDARQQIQRQIQAVDDCLADVEKALELLREV